MNRSRSPMPEVRNAARRADSGHRPVLHRMACLAIWSMVGVGSLVAGGAVANEQIDEMNASAPHEDGSVTGKVILGQPAGDYGFPVALVKPGRIHFCGGSLLDATTVLTAAHCVRNKSRHDFQVLHGTKTIHEGGSLVDLARQPLIHPRYSDRTVDYDIAVLKLARPLGGPYVQLATPASAPQMEQPGENGVVIGWGVSVAGKRKTSDRLLEGVQTVGGRGDCQQRMRAWDPTYRLTDRMICALHTSNNGGPCYGDSGGPLVRRASAEAPYFQLGVVSWGFPGCASPQKMAIFARVSQLLEWVEAVREPEVDIGPVANAFGGFNLEPVAFPRSLAEAEPFEMAAFQAVEPVIRRELGIRPEDRDVGVSEAFEVEKAADGSVRKRSILFRIAARKEFSVVMGATSEDGEQYYYSGYIPYADTLYFDRSIAASGRYPFATLLNGVPQFFAYDNSHPSIHFFSKEMRSEESLGIAQRFHAAD